MEEAKLNDILSPGQAGKISLTSEKKQAENISDIFSAEPQEGLRMIFDLNSRPKVMYLGKSQKWEGRTEFCIKLLSASLIAALFGTSLLIAAPDSFAPIVKSEKNKVVHIATTTTIKRPAYLDPFFERFFPNAPSERKSNALGSGFFISSDGYIITNNHVVEGADKIQILTVEQKRYDAKVIGTDPRTDLALIKIEGTGFPAVKMGVSANLEIGDWVIAIGNPLGLDFTVTAGIVSAVERDLTLGGESAGSSAYGKFIQTDTAINFGNSGGPLFNTKGEVVGINTAISANGQGLSFAVPVDVAKNVINQLKSKGKVERGYIGIGIQDLTHEMKSGFSVPADVQGVLINNVGQGTPAEKSGLKQGDVVIEFNGIKTLRTGDLQQAVAETEINKEVPVKIYRDGKLQTVRVKVGMPENTADAPDQKTKKKIWD
ncbi:hypothetical protein CHS0354_035205 [Potamilus streckersoni]|uniref:PDZ domain-containing protein n=1 Tax=Potamilus streckersoni TaxID=2493646 RepID=A0AAE0S386_9BIVA|nr:hypothetical protein CHS0354_035205 [Potamilus streckersoni]